MKMKKNKIATSTVNFEITKEQELYYYISLTAVNPDILFIVNKVFTFLKYNNTAGKQAIENYLFNKLGRYSPETGKRRFKVYTDMLNSIENNKLKNLWYGIDETYLADFWEVFFLIYSDFYILQNLAMQQ